jgi:hypothetical protein
MQLNVTAEVLGFDPGAPFQLRSFSTHAKVFVCILGVGTHFLECSEVGQNVLEFPALVVFLSDVPNESVQGNIFLQLRKGTKHPSYVFFLAHGSFEQAGMSFSSNTTSATA